MALLSSLLLGGLVAGGSIAGGLIQKKQAKQQRRFEAEQAQKQMDFQERMSNTAMQRSVADMKSAGINPILAGTGGGASIPMGSMATGSTAGAMDAQAINTMVNGLVNVATLGMLSNMNAKKVSALNASTAQRSSYLQYLKRGF